MTEVKANSLKDINEPLLISDGRPEWLVNILSKLEIESSVLKEKSLLVVLYILMYEFGFYFEDGPFNETLSYDVNVMRSLNDPNILINHINYTGFIYVAYFTHNLMKPKSIKVVAYFSSCNYCVINFFSPDGSLFRSLFFSMANYISIDDKKNTVTLKDMIGLNLMFKNMLTIVMNSLVLRDIENKYNLLSLPLHILQDLCKYLNGKQFMRLMLSSKYLFDNFSQDETLWRHFSSKEHKGLNKLGHESWRNHYIYVNSREEILMKRPLLW